MRALSLLPPWGLFMVTGEKRIETRGWAPSVSVLRPGEWLAIHHSKRWDPDTQTDLINEKDLPPDELSDTSRAFLTTLFKHGCRSLGDVPLGSIIGACRFHSVARTDIIRARPDEYFKTPHERLFGNYGSNRWGWVFSEACRFVDPIPVRGAQGLWVVEADTEDAINATLRAAGFDAPEVDRGRTPLEPQRRLL